LLLQSKQPALVEAVVDPNETPQPARATAEQALHMARARGTPNASR